MRTRTSISYVAAFGIFVAIVAMLCSTQFAFVAGAQYAPQYGGNYGGYGGYGQPAGYDQQAGYGQQTGYGQQAPYSGGYAGQAAGTGNFVTIQGLEGLQGFVPGENRLSLAVIPVTQQNNQLGFQVVGFAITSPQTSTATAYSLQTPLAGIIDPSQNTLQIDLSNLGTGVQQAGYLSADQVYTSLRTDNRVILIDVDMNYQGTQGTQAIFNVNSVSIIPPDGKMQAFQMQQPTQLIIDSQSMRLYMVAFPQMIDMFTGFYGATYGQVLPIVYAQPIPILAPVFVPFLTPFPIFFSSFVSFSPFFFGGGFTPFFDRDRDFDRFNGHFPLNDRAFAQSAVSQFNQFRGGAQFKGGEQFRAGENIGARNVIGQQPATKIGAGEGFRQPGTVGAGIGAEQRLGGNVQSGAVGAGQFKGVSPSFSGNIPSGMGTGIGNIKPSGMGIGAGIGNGHGLGGGGIGGGRR